MVGNTLTLMVMSQRSYRANPFSVYLACLAVVDTGSLMTWAFRWWVMAVLDRGVGDMECKVDVGLKYAFRQSGYALVISLTADRYLVVRHPLRAVTWSTQSRAFWMCLVILVTSFGYAVPYFVLGESLDGYACIMTGGPYATVYIWSVVVFGLVVPFVGISYMNFSIAFGIRTRLQYRGRCREHSRMEYSQASSSASDRDKTDYQTETSEVSLVGVG